MPWPQVRRRTKHTAGRRSVRSHCPRALSFAPKTALSGRVFAALKPNKGVVEKIKTCGECVTRGDVTAGAPNSSGSLAMLEEMRRASSRVSSFGRSARAALFLSK